MASMIFSEARIVSAVSLFNSRTCSLKSISNKRECLQIFPSSSSKFPVFRCSLTPELRYGPEYFPNYVHDPKFIRVLDTTLRDGEQAPGASLSSEEKLLIARQLAKLRVDVIEAGFPAASKEDFEAVRMIAKEVGNAIGGDGYVPVIGAVARCNGEDIKAAWDALMYAKRPRVTLFISTSRIHREYKLKKSKEQVLEIAVDAVKLLKDLGCEDIEFASEDSARTEREFLYRIFGEAIKAGATTIDVTDTVGICTPEEFGELVADIKANTPGVENVVISTHCHNDLGLATANTLAGIGAGARQVEVTVNGIGERAGNASLEEIVMAIKCHGEKAFGGLYTGITTQQISIASQMVEEYTGLKLQPHKAIVGANVFAYETGVHQDEMIEQQGTCLATPSDIGLEPSSTIVGIALGNIRRRALEDPLRELGYELTEKQLDNVIWRVREETEKKKRMSNAGMMSLLLDEVLQDAVVWRLCHLQVTSGTHNLSTATVKLIDADGTEHFASSSGSGPIHSACKAVDLIVKEPVTIVDLSMDKITDGIDGLTTSRVVIRGKNLQPDALRDEPFQFTFSGSGGKADIVLSSVKGYLDALNKLIVFKQKLPVKQAAAERKPVSV